MATQYTAGLSAGQILTAATMNQIGAVWETWTPALTGSVTNPNLGSTGTATGRYGRVQKTVFGIAQFTFGGTGINAGSGFYFCSIPFTAQAAAPVVGSWVGYDQSLDTIAIGTMTLDTTSRMSLMRNGVGGNQFLVASTVPWTWAASDFIRLQFQYEAA